MATAQLSQHDPVLIHRQTAGLKKCLEDSRIHIAFAQWRKYGLPGLNTGLIATVTTLTLYDKAAGKKLSWDLFVKLIKPMK